MSLRQAAPIRCTRSARRTRRARARCTGCSGSARRTRPRAAPTNRAVRAARDRERGLALLHQLAVRHVAIELEQQSERALRLLLAQRALDAAHGGDLFLRARRRRRCRVHRGAAVPGRWHRDARCCARSACRRRPARVIADSCATSVAVGFVLGTAGGTFAAGTGDRVLETRVSTRRAPLATRSRVRRYEPRANPRSTRRARHRRDRPARPQLAIHIASRAAPAPHRRARSHTRPRRADDQRLLRRRQHALPDRPRSATVRAARPAASGSRSRDRRRLSSSSSLIPDGAPAPCETRAARRAAACTRC